MQSFFSTYLHPGNRKETREKYQCSPQPKAFRQYRRDSPKMILQGIMTASRETISAQSTVDCRMPFQHVYFRQSPIPTLPRTSHAMPATIVQTQPPRRHVFQVHDQRPRRTIGRAMYGNMTPFRHEPNNHDSHHPGKSRKPRGINHRNPETSQRGSNTYKYKQYRPTHSGPHFRRRDLPFSIFSRCQTIPRPEITELAAPRTPGQ